MKMTSLQALHRSMISLGLDMQQFRIDHGHVSFDCLFSTRDKPNFTLALTSRGANPKFFLFQVKPGYWITPFFDGFYSELLELLKTGVNSGNPLIPKEFLSQINDCIPTEASAQRTPSPAQVIRLRPDIVEERDRPYFDTWIRWQPGRGPRAENLQKTQLALGDEALAFSKRMNASSRWSAVDLGKNWQEEAAG